MLDFDLIPKGGTSCPDDVNFAIRIINMAFNSLESGNRECGQETFNEIWSQLNNLNGHLELSRRDRIALLRLANNVKPVFNKR